MTKAFLAVNGGQGAASARVRELVEQLTDGVVAALVRRHPGGGTFHIEDVHVQQAAHAVIQHVQLWCGNLRGGALRFLLQAAPSISKTCKTRWNCR